MCGVALICCSDPSDSGSLIGVSKKIISALRDRGPNSEGFWISPDGDLALCHTRLSIQGLDSSGSQPIESDNGAWVISFNGEVYNKHLLQAHLANFIGSNYQPRGSSDTEILIKYIEKFGLTQALKSIEGMFSIIAYNKNTRKIYICGDKFGEKPLYYGTISINSKKYFIATSDLKTLSCLKVSGLSYNNDSISELLYRGYTSAPFTIYNDIYKIEQNNII